MRASRLSRSRIRGVTEVIPSPMSSSYKLRAWSLAIRKPPPRRGRGPDIAASRQRAGCPLSSSSPGSASRSLSGSRGGRRPTTRPRGQRGCGPRRRRDRAAAQSGVPDGPWPDLRFLAAADVARGGAHVPRALRRGAACPVRAAGRARRRPHRATAPLRCTSSAVVDGRGRPTSGWTVLGIADLLLAVSLGVTTSQGWIRWRRYDPDSVAPAHAGAPRDRHSTRPSARARDGWPPAPDDDGSFGSGSRAVRWPTRSSVSPTSPAPAPAAEAVAASDRSHRRRAPTPGTRRRTAPGRSPAARRTVPGRRPR